MGFGAARVAWQSCRAMASAAVTVACTALLAITPPRPDLLLRTARICLKLRRPRRAYDAVARMNAIDVRRTADPDRTTEQMTKIAAALCTWRLRGGKGCAAQRHCFGTACHRAAVRVCLLVARGPSSGGWQHIVGTMGGTRGPPAKIGRRVAAPRRTATCTCHLFAPGGSISGSPDGSRNGQRSSASSQGRKSAARGSRGRTASPRSQARTC